MLTQRVGSFFHWQRLITAGLLIAVLVFVLVGNQLSAFLARPCQERPVYRPDVTPQHRAMLDKLFDQGYLYCVKPPDDLAALAEPIYWGSDGMDAILFFQVSTFDGFAVETYDYRGSAGSDLLFVTPEGDAPLPGFVPDIVSRAMTNQAPEGAKYFFRVDGAPRQNDRGVHVELTGPIREDKGLAGRDALRDLSRITGLIEGRQTTLVTAEFLVYPPKWASAVRRKVDPRLATADGKPDPNALRSIDNLTEPGIYQAASGDFGSTIWVVGTISTSLPSLVLVDAGNTISPKTDMAWEAAYGKLRLHHFAFDQLPSGKAYEARYWIDRRSQATHPPDRVWTVSFP